MAARQGAASPLLFAAITLGAGGLSAYWVRDYTGLYESLVTPPLALPFWAFPVVGAVLWAATGIAAGLAMESRSHPATKASALKLYGAHLALAAARPVFFLRWELFLIAFAMEALLWAVLAGMTAAFAHAERQAGLLVLPRLGWSAYILYLLLGICILN